MELIYPKGAERGVEPRILEELSGQMPDVAAQVFEGAEPPVNPSSPLEALAATTVLLVLMLESSAATNGVDVADDIVFHAGSDLLEELAEVAGAAGIHEFSEDEVEKAFYRAADLYRVSSPRINQDDLTREFEEIVAADREGRLGQVLPGIEQAEARASAGDAQAEQQPQQSAYRA